MLIENRVAELLAAKFGGKEKVVLQRVAQDMRLTYSTVSRWAKSDVDRIDTPVLEAWCKYLNCGVGDILVYRPED